MEKRAEHIVKILNKLYPNPKPALVFRTPFELLVAAVLSAQCTDARVNIVTKQLFHSADTPEKILALGKEKLAEFIRPTGFYKAKTKNLLAAAKILVKKFKGKVPASLEQMQTLPGVGRKTASVVLAQAFGIPAFPVDRHVFRTANRLAFANRANNKPAKTPEETDLNLRKNIPQKLWIRLHLQLVYHGRAVCRPKPKCKECGLLLYCPYGRRFKHTLKHGQ